MPGRLTQLSLKRARHGHGPTIIARDLGMGWCGARRTHGALDIQRHGHYLHYRPIRSALTQDRCQSGRERRCRQIKQLIPIRIEARLGRGTNFQPFGKIFRAPSPGSCAGRVRAGLLSPVVDQPIRQTKYGIARCAGAESSATAGMAHNLLLFAFVVSDALSHSEEEFLCRPT